MGAFLLVTSKHSGFFDFEKKTAPAIDVFRQKQLLLNKKFVKNKFILYVFNKQRISVNNFIEYDELNFIAGTGTYIYKSKAGREALDAIFHDFSFEKEFSGILQGDFAIIIFRDGNLIIFNSSEGLYRIYNSSDHTIFSSSILPLVKLSDDLVISKQEFFEYVLTGAHFGDKTIFKGIELLDSGKNYQLSPDIRISSKPEIKYISPFRDSDLEEIVFEVKETLSKYFRTIGKIFEDNIVIPLTGGFDTRLVYAMLKAEKIMPDHAFVLKKDNHPDIEIAELIAAADDIKLDILPNDFPDFTQDSTLSQLKRQFFLYDGLGIGGIFQFFSGMDVWDQLDYRLLLLDGGGGEIYRNIHNLPDAEISLNKYIEKVLHKKDFSLFTDQYNNKEYLEQVRIKIINSIQQSVISRQNMEIIFPFFYQKYWMGQINSLANQFSYYLTPFSDHIIALQSVEIPVKYKNKGYFEALLIRYSDENLARVPTNYGISFYDLNENQRTVKELIKQFVPDSLSNILKPVHKKIFKKNNLPFYSQSDYVNKALRLDSYVKNIMGVNSLEVGEFIDFHKATDPAMISRALSVELLKSGMF